MPSELVFTVHPATAQRAQMVTLAEAGLRERSDLQEWVRSNPEILGPDVRIVTFEFDRWDARDGVAADRLDLLGLDSSGRLVVAELKRGAAPDTIEMQAIKYAAFASRFTPASLAEHHAAYLSKTSGTVVKSEDALAVLEEHSGGALDPDLLRRPRIVLLAASFSPQVTASAVWLTEMGVDVALVQFGAYRAEHDLILTVSQLWPVASIEDFTVSPRQAELRVEEERVQHRREDRTVSTIIAEGLLADGETLRINVAGVPVQARESVAHWLGTDASLGLATWRNQPRAPLIWQKDESAWSPTGLAKEIVALAYGERPAVVPGPRLWLTTDGVSLSDLARSRLPAKRDWSDLHRVLSTIQAGEWTTYGDIADAVGSSAIAVGQHLTNCEDDECNTGAHRVLSANGRVNADFRWADPQDTRNPRSMLESEGVRFFRDTADEGQRVTAESLLERLQR